MSIGKTSLKINHEFIGKAAKYFQENDSNKYGLDDITKMVKEYVSNEIDVPQDVCRNDKSLSNFVRNIYMLCWIYTVLVVQSGGELKIMNIGKFSSHMTKSKLIKHVKTQEVAKSKPKHTMAFRKAPFVKDLGPVDEIIKKLFS